MNLLFMNHCAIFAAGSDPAEVYSALQAKLIKIESWALLNRVSFGVHKCSLLPHRNRQRPSLTFFDETINSKDEITCLGINFAAPSRAGQAWQLLATSRTSQTRSSREAKFSDTCFVPATKSQLVFSEPSSRAG